MTDSKTIARTITCKTCGGDGVVEARHPMWGSPSCPEAYVQVTCDDCEGDGTTVVRVQTEHVYPPIPDRSCDWSAIDSDHYDEGEPIGRGATEQEAIDDLISQLEEREA